MEKPANKEYRVKTTGAFKLKDKTGRQFKIIQLKKLFGFMPEEIIVEKVHGMSNTLVIRAVLTEAEIKREDAAIKSSETNHGSTDTKPATK